MNRINMNTKPTIYFLGVIFLLCSATSYAGKLIIKNASNQSIICQIGNDQINVKRTAVKPNKTFSFYPNKNNPPIINWVKCGKLKHNHIGVTPKSSDHFFIYDERAQNVLSVLLYPYIPTYPYGDFSAMLRRLVTEFQAQHPTISLNLVISNLPEYDSYTYANFAHLLGQDGFDVVEVDTMLLPDLVAKGLILPLNTIVDNFWSAAIAGASYQGKLYGVPSWLCMEFLFTHERPQHEIESLSALVDYLSHLSPDRTRLIGDFNNRWTIAAFYLNASTAWYGYKNLAKIPYQHAVNEVVRNLVALTDQCYAKQQNRCTNLDYQSLQEGEIQKLFAQNKSHAYIGYSETSFYMKLFTSAPFYAVPMPFGKQINTLVYTDAYVKSASRCNNDSCASAFKAFTDYMSKVETRKWIVESEDLGMKKPPRRLLPAIKEFYEKINLDDADGIYKEFVKIASRVKAFPPVSKERIKKLRIEICEIIKTTRPEYQCQVDEFK